MSKTKDQETPSAQSPELQFRTFFDPTRELGDAAIFPSPIARNLLASNIDPETIHLEPGQMTINGIPFKGTWHWKGESGYGSAPQSISISEESYLQHFTGLRSGEGVSVNTGQSRSQISISAIFEKERVPTTLEPLLFSLKKFPLCIIENELLRRALPVFLREPIGAFVQQVNVNTLPGYPGALQLSIQLIWFNHRPFTPLLRFREDWINPKVIRARQEYQSLGRQTFIERYGHPADVFAATGRHQNASLVAGASVYSAAPFLNYVFSGAKANSLSEEDGDILRTSYKDDPFSDEGTTTLLFPIVKPAIYEDSNGNKFDMLKEVEAVEASLKADNKFHDDDLVLDSPFADPSRSLRVGSKDFNPIIKRLCAKYEIPVPFLKAIIYKESDWIPWIANIKRPRPRGGPPKQSSRYSLGTSTATGIIQLLFPTYVEMAYRNHFGTAGWDRDFRAEKDRLGRKYKYSDFGSRIAPRMNKRLPAGVRWVGPTSPSRAIAIVRGKTREQVRALGHTRGLTPGSTWNDWLTAQENLTNQFSIVNNLEAGLRKMKGTVRRMRDKFGISEQKYRSVYMKLGAGYDEKNRIKFFGAGVFRHASGEAFTTQSGGLGKFKGRIVRGKRGGFWWMVAAIYHSETSFDSVKYANYVSRKAPTQDCRQNQPHPDPISTWPPEWPVPFGRNTSTKTSSSTRSGEVRAMAAGFLYEISPRPKGHKLVDVVVRTPSPDGTESWYITYRGLGKASLSARVGSAKEIPLEEGETVRMDSEGYVDAAGRPFRISRGELLGTLLEGVRTDKGFAKIWKEEFPEATLFRISKAPGAPKKEESKATIIKGRKLALENKVTTTRAKRDLPPPAAREALRTVLRVSHIEIPAEVTEAKLLDLAKEALEDDRMRGRTKALIKSLRDTIKEDWIWLKHPSTYKHMLLKVEALVLPDFDWCENHRGTPLTGITKSIALGFSHNLAVTPLAGHSFPTVQYMGGSRTNSAISLQVSGDPTARGATPMPDGSPNTRSFIDTFRTLHNNYREATIRYREFMRDLPIGIVNPMLNLFGIEDVMIEGVDISTTPGNPTSVEMVLRLVSQNSTTTENSGRLQPTLHASAVEFTGQILDGMVADDLLNLHGRVTIKPVQPPLSADKTGRIFADLGRVLDNDRNFLRRYLGEVPVAPEDLVTILQVAGSPNGLAPPPPPSRTRPLNALASAAGAGHAPAKISKAPRYEPVAKGKLWRQGERSRFTKLIQDMNHDRVLINSQLTPEAIKLPVPEVEYQVSVEAKNTLKRIFAPAKMATALDDATGPDLDNSAANSIVDKINEKLPKGKILIPVRFLEIARNKILKTFVQQEIHESTKTEAEIETDRADKAWMVQRGSTVPRLGGVGVRIPPAEIQAVADETFSGVRRFPSLSAYYMEVIRLAHKSFAAYTERVVGTAGAMLATRQIPLDDKPLLIGDLLKEADSLGAGAGEATGLELGVTLLGQDLRVVPQTRRLKQSASMHRLTFYTLYTNFFGSPFLGEIQPGTRLAKDLLRLGKLLSLEGTYAPYVGGKRLPRVKDSSLSPRLKELFKSIEGATSTAMDGSVTPTYRDLALPANPISGLDQDIDPGCFFYHKQSLRNLTEEAVRLLGEDPFTVATKKAVEKVLGRADHVYAELGRTMSQAKEKLQDFVYRRMQFGAPLPSGGNVYTKDSGATVQMKGIGTTAATAQTPRYETNPVQQTGNAALMSDVGSSASNGAATAKGRSDVRSRARLLDSDKVEKTEAKRKNRKENAGAFIDFSMQNSRYKNFAKEVIEERTVANKFGHTFDVKNYEEMFEKTMKTSQTFSQSINHCFPTFQVQFVEEDTESVFFSTVFDDFYGVNSVASIRIVSRKDMPGAVCTLELLDLDGLLYNKGFEVKGDEWQKSKDLTGPVDIKGDAVREITSSDHKDNPFYSTMIKDGMKVIVKMGHSNDPARLETVFVGQIASFSGINVITVVCQSYGSELVAQKFGTDPSQEVDFWNSDTGDIIHDVLDREELRHFGRWELSDVELFGGLFGVEEIRPDGKTKKVWTMTPSIIDDNIYAPSVDTYIDLWDQGWGDVEYVYWDTTVWNVLKEMELRHPGYIAYPVPYGDRMTIFFGAPDQLYLSAPAFTREERISQMIGNPLNQYELLEDLVQWGGRGAWERGVPGLTDGVEEVGMDSSDAKKVDAIINSMYRLQEIWSAGWGDPQGLHLHPVEQWSRGAEYGSSPAHDDDDMKDWFPSGGSLSRDAMGGMLLASRSKELWKRFQEIINKETGVQLTKDETTGRWAVTGDSGGLNFSDLLVEAKVHQRGRLKQFRSYILATDSKNIIQNNIRADKTGTFNAIELRHSSGNVDIADFQKGTGVSVIKTAADDGIKEVHLRRDIQAWPNASTTELGERYAAQLMANSIKKIYKGNLLLLGQPEVKPYDVIFISDTYSDLGGPVEVEEVVHSLDMATGMTTDIVPNMIVSVSEDVTTLFVDSFSHTCNEVLSEDAKDFLMGMAIGGAPSAIIPAGLKTLQIASKVAKHAREIGREAGVTALKGIRKSKSLSNAITAVRGSPMTHTKLAKLDKIKETQKEVMKESKRLLKAARKKDKEDYAEVVRKELEVQKAQKAWDDRYYDPRTGLVQPKAGTPRPADLPPWWKAKPATEAPQRPGKWTLEDREGTDWFHSLSAKQKKKIRKKIEKEQGVELNEARLAMHSRTMNSTQDIWDYEKFVLEQVQQRAKIREWDRLMGGPKGARVGPTAQKKLGDRPDMPEPPGGMDTPGWIHGLTAEQKEKTRKHVLDTLFDRDQKGYKKLRKKALDAEDLIIADPPIITDILPGMLQLQTNTTLATQRAYSALAEGTVHHMGGIGASAAYHTMTNPDDSLAGGGFGVEVKEGRSALRSLAFGMAGTGAMLAFPLAMGAAGLIAGAALYKLTSYNSLRQPILITPLIKGQKPYIIGMEGFENDSLIANTKKRWAWFSEDLAEGLEIIDAAYDNFWD